MGCYRCRNEMYGWEILRSQPVTSPVLPVTYSHDLMRCSGTGFIADHVLGKYQETPLGPWFISLSHAEELQ
jgi:hypothetical protein